MAMVITNPIKTEIVDTAFAHAPGVSWYNKPEYIEWVRGSRGEKDVCFFTDRNIGQAKTHPAKRKIAMLIEPRCVDEVGMLSTIDALPHLDYVLSYDRSYANIFLDKFKWYPIGGCWIEAASQSCDHTKTKLCSMVASDKNWAPGHILRHKIAKAHGDKIDLWGKGYKPVEFKSTALNPYMFSVAVENDIVNDMFTEKLIDCFVTGTVPIYWGTASIDQWFDMRGVLTFSTPEEFQHIMDTITPDTYISMRPSIVQNYFKALQYRIAEDWLFVYYSKLFTE